MTCDRSRRLRLLILGLLLPSALLGCNKKSDGEAAKPPDSIEGQAANLLADRVVRQVEVYSTTGDLKAPPEVKDWTAAEIQTALGNICNSQFKTTPPTWSAVLPLAGRCAGGADMTGMMTLCQGHLALQLAKEVRPQFIQFQPDGTGPGSYALSNERVLEANNRTSVALGIPTASDSATWALMAGVLFRSATVSMSGALANCNPAILEATVLTKDGSPYGNVVAGYLADATTSIAEAQEAAHKYVLAASAAKQAETTQQLQQGVQSAWRDPQDSRLEAASILGYISMYKYDPEEPVATSADNSGLFPVAIATPPSRGEKRAQELILSTRVNPCIPGAGAYCDHVTPREESGRSRADLAIDMTWVLLGQSKTRSDAEDVYAALLAKRGITLDDVEQAARRIVRKARVLGQPIVLEPEGQNVWGPRRVFGPIDRGMPVSPYYLYAQTLGRMAFEPLSGTYSNANDDGPFSAVFSAAYAMNSVFGAYEWLNNMVAPSPLADPENQAEYAKAARETLAYARAQSGNSQRVRIEGVATEDGTRINAVRLEREGLPFNNSENAGLKCSVWLSEAGLECGLEDTIAAQSCAGVADQFHVDSTWTVDGDTTSVYVDADSMPHRRYSADETQWSAMYEGDRLYAICDIDGRKQVVFAMEIAEPPSDGWYGLLTPPLSQPVLDSLSADLAADPVDPGQSSLSCAGVPYNTKLALEDELTEAITGEDGIESSFAYYLKLAREAADKADGLGDQLVDHGLQMDIRAEQAREELEDLCGGVVDVSSLERKACDEGYNCDLLRMLREEGDNSELSGIRKCLGLSDAPVWAAVGSVPLCVWQYFPPRSPPSGGNANPAAPPGPPPMVCPENDSTCETTFVKSPQPLPNGGTCADAFNQVLRDALTDTLDHPPTPADNLSGFVAWPIRETLNLEVSSKRAETVGSECASDLASMRRGHVDELKTKNFFNQAALLPIADSIGFEEDIYGFPALTINGRPWVTFGNVTDGPLAPSIWPCVQHPALRPHEYSEATQEELERIASTPGSLLAESPTDCSSYVDAGIRLREAVIALKGMTGASFKNVTRRRITGTGYFKDVGSTNGKMLYAGYLPDTVLFGDTDMEHYVSRDRREIAFWNADKPRWGALEQFTTRDPTYPTQIKELESDPKDYYGTFGTGGWLDPTLLWTDDTNCSVSGGDVPSRVLGCGSIAKLLRGEGTDVRSQVAYDGHLCTAIPDEIAKKNYRLTEYCNVNSQYNEQCSQWLNAYYEQPGDPTAITIEMPKPKGCVCQGFFGAGPTGYVTFKQLRDQYFMVSDPPLSTSEAPDPKLRYIWDELRSYPCAKNGLELGTHVRRDTALDALELACAATLGGTVDCSEDLSGESLSSADDFPRTRARVQCAADRMQDVLTRLYLPMIPREAVEAVREHAVAQTFPAFRGQFGEDVATLSGQLATLVSQKNVIVTKIRDVGSLLDRALLQANVLDLNMQSADLDSLINSGEAETEELRLRIENLKSRQAISSAVTNCVVATTDTLNYGAWVSGGGGALVAKAASICANTAQQIRAEHDIIDAQDQIGKLAAEKYKLLESQILLGKQATEEEKRLVWQQLSMDVTQKLDEMRLAMDALRQTQISIHGTITHMDAVRNKAQRAAAKVLLLSNDSVGRTYGASSAMRARMDTLAFRYHAARDNAIKLSFLARRAVEQRLGIDLNAMEDDMTLVPAPQSWVNKLCTMSGIDYQRIRKGDTAVESWETPKGYADEYVGDWLTKLENVIQSYRIDYPFQDGGDVAVVSIRDEIARSKKACDVPGWNLLFQTDGTATLPTSSTGVATTVEPWQYTCSANTQVQIGAAAPESPFVCNDMVADNCRALGEAKSVSLKLIDGACSAVGSGGSGSADEGDVPLQGLVYWYQGDECTAPSSPANQPSVCVDKSGNNRTLKLAYGAQVLPTVGPGIGGRQSLTIPGNLSLNTAPPYVVPPADAYTQIFVVRRATNLTSYSQAGQYTGADNVLKNLGVSFGGTSRAGPQGFVAYGYGNWSLSSGRYYYIATNLPTAPQMDATRGDVYAVRAAPGVGGAPGFVRVYVNGYLQAETTLQNPVPHTFGADVLRNESSAGALTVGEIIAYSRNLTDQEFARVNDYLLSYYSIDRKKPQNWLSGDMVKELRTGTGQSMSSGYSFGSASNMIRDRSTGWERYTVSTDLEARAPVSFGNSSVQHYALQFDGVDDQISFYRYSWKNERATDGGTNLDAASTLAGTDYAATIVARCDDATRTHRLWGSPGGTPAGSHLWLELNGVTGAFGFSGSTMAGVSTIPAVSTQGGLASCGPNQFIVTLRASSTKNSMDIFVNGQLRHTAANVIPISLMSYFGHAGGVANRWFRGDMAEAMVHHRAVDDAEVQALHASLGAKFNIPVATSTGAAGVAATGPTRVRQSVNVAAGDYWVSWHQRASEPKLGLHVDRPAGLSAFTFTPAGTSADTIWPIARAGGATPDEGAITDSWLQDNWVRYYVKVPMPAPGTASFGFVPPGSPGGAEIALAAPQVQRADDSYSTGPKDYFPTKSSLSAPLGKCEDSDGTVFRTKWERGCEYYCPPGLGTNCVADGIVSDVPQRCYYELKFPVSLEEIEKGELLPAAGFARGNFNYRFDQLALNFVGTAVKDCSESKLSATCYAGNFLQYSLQHGAPYRIRNYDGDVEDAPLFTGNVQQAKGLLAERYISNPLSSADDSLLKNYWRDEFRGRPIDGNFTLRVYDADGLSFEALEDVQLLMRYRYWTRFER